MAAPRRIDEILARLEKVKGPDSKGFWTARCPFHADTKPSFRLHSSGTGNCFSCGRTWKYPELLKELGLARPPEIPLAIYDYRDASGKLRFQVLRMPGKRFPQRRPDPTADDGWIYDMKGVVRIIYRLPEVLSSPAASWVFVVEGEKDTDNLVRQGLVATTNPGGAGKWYPEYSEALRGRRVAILADNDDAGHRHAAQVAASLAGIAAMVATPDLPDLPPKGDVSDWLGQGHTVEELLRLTELAAPAVGELAASTNGARPVEPELWAGSRWWPIAQQLIARLKAHGRFIDAEGAFFYFDRETKELCGLDGFEMAILLNRRYRVNARDALYFSLVAEMTAEAATSGEKAIVRRFAHYDPVANTVYLDLGAGAMLRLDGRAIRRCDNGTDGILFMPTPGYEPWSYQADAPTGLIRRILISSLIFSEEGPMSAEEQRVLFLTWLLSIAFESVQPTKPLALAVGPAGSGKSTIFRRVGMMLFGSRFNIDVLRRDKEEDYYVAITNSPFVVFDGVDQPIPWLNDVLASTATGMRVTKRQLYTTNAAVTFVSHAFIALTAHTPRFRREDVAQRLLMFTLERLPQKRPDWDLLKEVQESRSLLLSEYAGLVNRMLATPPPENRWTSLRLADFAQVIIRLGAALGVQELAASALDHLKRTQYQFATEETELFAALDLWIDLDQPGLFTSTNADRHVTTAQLAEELRKVTMEHGITWRFGSPVALGRQLERLMEALSLYFQITRQHTKKGNTWAFQRVDTL